MKNCEINLSDLKQPTPKMFSIRNFKDNMGRYKYDAAYQRDFVWDKKLNEKLLKSILSNIPIGSLHFVQSKDYEYEYVLDGKQRAHGIMEFLNDKFTIAIDENEYYWSSIEKNVSKNEKIGKVREHILNYEFMKVTWESMNLIQQSAVFEHVNAGVHLVPNEVMYCANFYGKCFIEYIFNQYLKPIHKFTRKEIRGERESESSCGIRFGGLRWCHHICIKIFGVEFDSRTDLFRSISKAYVNQSSEYINNKIKRILNEKDVACVFDSCLINDDLLKKLNIYDKLEKFGKLVKTLSEILDYNGTIKKHIHSTDLLEFICYFFHETEQKTLTNALLIKDKNKYYDFVKDFVNFKSSKEGKQLRRHGNNEKECRTIYSWMDEHRRLITDSDEKQQKLTPDEILITNLKSDGKCKGCGCVLSENNTQVDHCLPSSLYSSTETQSLCESCNRRKSNLTINDLNLFL